MAKLIKKAAKATAATEPGLKIGDHCSAKDNWNDKPKTYCELTAPQTLTCESFTGAGRINVISETFDFTRGLSHSFHYACGSISGKVSSVTDYGTKDFANFTDIGKERLAKLQAQYLTK